MNATQTGEASIVDGAAVITNSFQYAGYTIVIEEIINDYISMDVLINALSGSTDAVDVCFYPENFAGDIYSECTDKISVTAGTKTTITLKAKDYLVDGQLTGIGVALLGGPEWNTPLEGGGYDRISVTISDIRREGDNAQLMAASTATVGLSNANAAGAASAVDGTVVISDTFRYAGYEITLVEDTNTYICMDVLLTTLSNSTDSINLRLYPSNFAGDIYNEYTALVPVTAGTKTTIKLKVDDYLVDGQLSGIGLAIFGGPEWNTPLDAGGYDRVSINISNVHLEGAEARAIDLNNGSVVVGIANSNTSGEASIIDGEVVITNGFQYIGYKITF